LGSRRRGGEGAPRNLLLPRSFGLKRGVVPWRGQRAGDGSIKVQSSTSSR
jgi:hypothetical protein